MGCTSSVPEVDLTTQVAPVVVDTKRKSTRRSTSSTLSSSLSTRAKSSPSSSFSLDERRRKSSCRRRSNNNTAERLTIQNERPNNKNTERSIQQISISSPKDVLSPPPPPPPKEEESAAVITTTSNKKKRRRRKVWKVTEKTPVIDHIPLSEEYLAACRLARLQEKPLLRSHHHRRSPSDGNSESVALDSWAGLTCSTTSRCSSSYHHHHKESGGGLTLRSHHSETSESVALDSWAGLTYPSCDDDDEIVVDDNDDELLYAALEASMMAAAETVRNVDPLFNNSQEKATSCSGNASTVTDRTASVTTNTSNYYRNNSFNSTIADEDLYLEDEA